MPTRHNFWRKHMRIIVSGLYGNLVYMPPERVSELLAAMEARSIGMDVMRDNFEQQVERALQLLMGLIADGAGSAELMGIVSQKLHEARVEIEGAIARLESAPDYHAKEIVLMEIHEKHKQP